MGEMTIKVEEALIVELDELASRRGVDREVLAGELLRSGMRSVDRAAGARRILALQPFHDTDSSNIVREWRDA